MRTYRIFCDDRKPHKLYSAVKDVKADTPNQACKQVKKAWPTEHLKAIEWPPTEAGLDWLEKHVNKP